MKRFHSLKRLCWSWALAALIVAAAASTAPAEPAIGVTTMIPDHVTPGEFMAIFVNVRNVGDTPMTGSVTIRYTFPDELSVTDPGATGAPSPVCTPSGQVNECVIDVDGTPPGRGLRYQTLSFVEPAATGTLTGQIEVSGGGASNSVTVPLSLNTVPIGPFDIKSFEVGITDNPTMPRPAQAGSAPAEIATSVELWSAAITQFNVPAPGLTIVSAPESFRDVLVHVPAGFVGNPTATPVRCTAAELAEPSRPPLQVPVCPGDSQVGFALVNSNDIVPVYNLVPPRGVPAEFGFYYLGIIVILRAKVRPADNGIDIVTAKAPSSTPSAR